MDHVVPSGAEIVEAATTFLFVPGDRPERFTKAMASGTDCVIIDLEDAVAPSERAAALRHTCEALASSTTLRALVRVNGVDASTHAEELDALGKLSTVPGHGLLGLMVPKAQESPALGTMAGEFLTRGLAVLALVESAQGVLDAPHIARLPGITRLAFGPLDYAVDIESETSPRALDWARSCLVVASRAAGIATPIDGPSTSIQDTAAVRDAALSAKELGFGAALCIHPRQVDAVRAAFAPSPEQIAWAERVVGTGDQAAQVDGEMIDAPVVKKARNILGRAGRLA